MSVNGWIYYNKAAIPNCAPHEEPDITPIKTKNLWEEMSPSPIFARWTTGFDSEVESEWWYVVRMAPFKSDELSKKVQKHIRQAVKKCYVKQVEIAPYIDELFDCYSEAVKGYKNGPNPSSKESFSKNYLKLKEIGVECWASFSCEDDKLIGYMTVGVFDDYAEAQTSKYDPKYRNLGCSDLLHYEVYDFYLNKKGKKYVSSGARNISHETNVQDYLIDKFMCKKAYCNLHIAYNPKYKWIIKLAYVFRWALIPFKRLTIVKQALSVFKMESIVRKQKKKRK